MIRALLFGPVNLTGHYGREEDVLMIRPATITILAICLIYSIASETQGASASVTIGARVRPPPASTQKTVHAKAFPGPFKSSISALDLVRIGTVVPEADIAASAADTHQLRFGLAVYPSSQTYPAISSDAGVTWRIDGPLLYMAAAEAPNITTAVGPIGSDGAYFWGQGGNVVKTTTDGGRHWWESRFYRPVYKVTESHGALDTVVLGNEVGKHSLQAFLYVSTDSGRMWRLRGELADVRWP